MNTKTMTRCAIMAALLCVIAPLSIPLTSLVPISLGTLMVMLSGTILGSKQGLIAVIIYLFAGMAGLPVFAEYSSGLAAVFGVTGGFLFGYLPLAYFSGFFYEKKRNTRNMIIGMFIGNIVLYLIGTIWFMVYLNSDLIKALSACVIPFLPGDLFKIFLVSVITPRIKLNDN